MSTTGPAIIVRGLGHGYRKGLGFKRKEVLAGVDFELASGARLGLVGPNGSGKSTLLRLITGIESPLSGSIEVLGSSPSSARTRRRIGYLPEDSPFPPELSAKSALELMGSLCGLHGRALRDRARQLLQEVGLEHESRTRLRRFSRGMLRRFGLAQAFLNDPDVLLLDEPTAGLDAEGFDVLGRLEKRARARGATVVIASHVMSDLVDHCDRLALIVGGAIAFFGAPAELLPASAERSLELEGLEPEAYSELARWVESKGGSVSANRPTLAALSRLFQGAAKDKK